MKTHSLCFKDRCAYANHRYDEDTRSIIIILVHRPKKETGKLEDVEGVESLAA